MTQESRGPAKRFWHLVSTAQAPTWVEAGVLLALISAVGLLAGLALAFFLTMPAAQSVVLAGVAVLASSVLIEFGGQVAKKDSTMRGRRLSFLGIGISLAGQIGFLERDPSLVTALLWFAGVTVTVWGLELQRRRKTV